MTSPSTEIKAPSSSRESQSQSPQPTKRHEIREAQLQEREAALIVDVNGRIIGCSPTTAALLGQMPQALINQSVTKVFPDLPLSANTLGYNLAYAIIHGARGDWTEQRARSSSGAPIPLEVLFTCRKFGNHYFFELNFRAKSMRSLSMTQACLA